MVEADVAGRHHFRPGRGHRRRLGLARLGRLGRRQGAEQAHVEILHQRLEGRAFAGRERPVCEHRKTQHLLERVGARSGNESRGPSCRARVAWRRGRARRPRSSWSCARHSSASGACFIASPPSSAALTASLAFQRQHLPPSARVAVPSARGRGESRPCRDGARHRRVAHDHACPPRLRGSIAAEHAPVLRQRELEVLDRRLPAAAAPRAVLRR